MTTTPPLAPPATNAKAHAPMPLYTLEDAVRDLALIVVANHYGVLESDNARIAEVKAAYARLRQIAP